MKLQIATNDFRDAAGITTFCILLILFVIAWTKVGAIGTIFALICGFSLLAMGVLAIVVQSMHYGTLYQQKRSTK